MEVEAVRTFVVAAQEGQFHGTAAALGITQQAVSKRIAALESQLRVRLFTRTARGVQLTIDGQAFLPHARAVLDAVERAAESVRPGRRALRVDVFGRRLASATLLRDFHQRHPEIELDVVALTDPRAAPQAVHDGTIDAAFWYDRLTRLPRNVRALHVLDEPLELLTGRHHELAAARSVSLCELPGRRIWIPGIVSGSEWAAYYEELAAAFNLSIDATGPNFGVEHLLDMLSDSRTLATFAGTRTRLVWTAHQDLRRIPVTDPTPAYPHALIWRADNRHPGLAALSEHLAGNARATSESWTPNWPRTLATG
jgi:DNA-binding transcriptional LysR family regulator